MFAIRFTQPTTLDQGLQREVCSHASVEIEARPSIGRGPTTSTVPNATNPGHTLSVSARSPAWIEVFAAEELSLSRRPDAPIAFEKRRLTSWLVGHRQVQTTVGQNKDRRDASVLG